MKLTFFGILFFVSFEVIGQNSIEEILDKFFDYYSKGQTNEAIDYAFQTNPYLPIAQGQLQNIKEKMKTIFAIVGEYYGYEIIFRKNVGNSLVYLICMVKHDRQPLYFTFQFYKPYQIWRLQILRFDDKLEEEEIKRYY